MSQPASFSERDIDVICAGHAAVDVIPRFPEGSQVSPEEMFKPGRLINVEEAAICTGGSAPNTGIALSKLGMAVTLLTRIGDDPFGKITLDLLQKAGVAEGVQVVRGEHSSYTLVICPPGFDRMFFHGPGSNDTFSSDDLDETFLNRARLFHLGYPPLMKRMYSEGGKELAKVFQKARQCGTITSLDMSLPDPNSESGKVDWIEIFERVLPSVDIFIPSIEEAMYAAMPQKYAELREKVGDGDIVDALEESQYTELSDLLLAWGVRVVVLKSGHRGFYVRTAHACELSRMQPGLVGKLNDWAGRELQVPAYQTENILSATGSGDCSIAGFLTAYLRGESPERAAATANAVGCQNLAALGATDGVKDWQYTVDMVNETDSPRILFQIDTPGWRFDDSLKVWYGPKDTK